jgi:hypothetical protein
MYDNLIFFNISHFSFAANFFVIIYSVLTLIDLLIKFKRPLNVKFFFILLVLLIAGFNLLNLLHVEFYTKKIINFCVKTFFTITFIQLLASLFFPHFKRFINLVSLAIFLFSTISITSIIINKYPIISKNNFIYQNEISPFNEGIQVPLLIDIVRLFLCVVYIGIILYFCFQLIINNSYKNIYFRKIKYFTYAIVLYVFLLVIFFILRNIFQNMNAFFNIAVTFSLDLLILNIIYKRPDFLNRSSQKIKLIYTFLPTKLSNIDSDKFNFIFFNQFYYLNKDAGVESLAKLMSASKNDINDYVNNAFGLDLNDLINKNRVDYFVELIRNPAYQNYTIDSLSKESGFVSRNAFYKPFKKFHGGNPSDLIDFYS